MDIGIVIALIKALAPKVSSAEITAAVDAWLDDHPEATTTVEDGSITEAKLASALAALINGKQDAPGTAGTAGQVLGLDNSLNPKWVDQSGGGGTSDYSDLTNKPQINSVTLSGNKSFSDLGIHNVPSGGTSGQVLKKASGTDYDAAWGTVGVVVETVSGSTPSITGVADHRYICGEVSELSIVAPESGIIDVLFTSGTTPTVLTVTSAKTGVTDILWANDFDPTTLDASTTYELNIMDGEYGVSCAWT